MDVDAAADGPFDWVDCGPPHEPLGAKPAWAGADHRGRAPRPPPIPERYASLSPGNSSVVVYDRAETNAWLQSTVAVSPGRADAPGGPGPASGPADHGEH